MEGKGRSFGERMKMKREDTTALCQRQSSMGQRRREWGQRPGNYQQHAKNRHVTFFSRYVVYPLFFK